MGPEGGVQEKVEGSPGVEAGPEQGTAGNKKC